MTNSIIFLFLLNLGFFTPSLAKTAPAHIKNLNPAAWMSQKILATTYQHCSVLDAPLVKKYENPYWSKEVEARRCDLLPQSTPVYRLGGDPALDHKKNVIDFVAGAPPESDCTSYLGAVYASAGLKFLTNDTPTRQVEASFTGAWIDWEKQANRCMDKVTFNNSTTLSSGDIVVWRRSNGGHTIMIEEVGQDPFGISGMPLDKCTASQINMAKFDFTVTQSTAQLTRKVGISRWHIVDYIESRNNSDAGLERYFMDMAIAACRAQHGNSLAVPLKDNYGNIQRLRVYRHHGTPQCLHANLPKLRGEECINSCPQL